MGVGFPSRIQLMSEGGEGPRIRSSVPPTSFLRGLFPKRCKGSDCPAEKEVDPFADENRPDTAQPVRKKKSVKTPKAPKVAKLTKKGG